jgi:hypothetical protein
MLPPSRSSRIIRGLYGPLAWIGGVATLVCIYEEALLAGYLPADLPTCVPMGLTTIGFSLWLHGCAWWE